MKYLMKERISRIVIMILIFFFICFVVCGNEETRAEELGLYARSAVLMDGKTGRVLYGKEEDVMRPMASTTKIMTCILALEKCELDEFVRVSKNAQRQPKVHMGMKEGETYSIEDLLYSLMLESHNDSAVAIAEHVGGSVEEFVRLMNEKAMEIGCKEVNFVTPNGLDGEYEGIEHSITAENLAKIMSYCVLESPMKNEFCRITQKQSHLVRECSGKRTINVYNHNALFQMMDGVISGKTGFTSKAGYCYVGAIESKGRTFVIALLGSGWPNNRNYKWADARKLLEYGMDSYHNVRVNISQSKNYIPVNKGIKNKIEVEVDGKGFEFLIKKEEKIKCKRELIKQLEAPVHKGMIVGKAIYTVGKHTIREYPIITEETIRKITFYDVYKQLFKEMILSCFL